MTNSALSRQGSPATDRTITTSTQGSTLADVLERVLDKGIVIAGDISVSVGSTELLSIRIRLLISSVDKAREIGINWWESDPYLSSQSRQLVEANQQLSAKIEHLEAQLQTLKGQGALLSPEMNLSGARTPTPTVSSLQSSIPAEENKGEAEKRQGQKGKQ